MSDCMQCWNTPCSCGYDYRNMSKQARLKLASVVLGVKVGELQKRFGNYVFQKHPMYEE